MRHSTLSVLSALVLGAIGCGGESASSPATTTSSVSSSTDPAPTSAPTEPALTYEPVAADEAPTTGLGSTDEDPSRFACTTDDDCMITPGTSCCPPCCDCPTVMRRDAWEQHQRICAVAECMGHDCRNVRCEPCGIITAVHCVAGLCTAS
jgi:hypothetical protein